MTAPVDDTVFPNISADAGSGSGPDIGADTARPTIAALFQQLVDDGRALVRAELRLYRAEAGRRALSGGLAAGLIIGALTLAQGALIALLIGIMLALAPHIGPLRAVAAVSGGALVICALLVWLGLRQINRMIDPDRP